MHATRLHITHACSRLPQRAASGGSRAPPAPPPLPHARRYERAHYPDGRRVNRWYLVDQHGTSHLAVIGIERDTKDGHYHYSAVRRRAL